MKYISLLMLVALSNNLFAQPVVSSFSPSSAPVGASVSIKGSNFNSTVGNNIVYFGAARAIVTAASDTLLVATVPYGATHNFITVTTGNLIAYSAKKFFVANGTSAGFTPTSFGIKQDYFAGDYVFSMAVADFNGDGFVILYHISSCKRQ